MTFANPLPGWALALVLVAAALVAVQAYRRFATNPRRRAILTSLRFVTLVVLVLFLMRPVARSAAAGGRDAIVPVLVDSSRSMGIEDADGRRRIDRARELLTAELLPTLGADFEVEILAFGDDVKVTAPDDLSATARRSDLAAAIADVRERYRGRPVAGIVLLSDGGDTGAAAEFELTGGEDAAVAPVFPIGIGSPAIGRDREVLSVTAADAALDDSRVDLAVSAISHGHGREPIALRLLENGRPVEVRRSVPAAEGVPIREVFQVSPGRGASTVYTVEVPLAAGELVPENNARSALVQPPSRPRRVLLVEGAPGFEHSFMKRALAGDRGLEVDSAVRQGRNDQGSDTFYIQASRSRSAALASGYPQKRDELFRYDAIVLANVDRTQFSQAQLEATRAFVAERGGGLLVLGARSFLKQGLLDTPLVEVLPLDLSERGGGAVPAVVSRGTNRVTLTETGSTHPIMQLAAGAEETRKKWDAMPALASTAPLGGPRPGAAVLAVTAGAGGSPRALIAVQRYGEGRSLVFTGEASWRWRMLLPASDRVYDTFWRQAIRWLALPAGDPVAVLVPAGSSAGDTVAIEAIVRDAAFEPQRDATVDLQVTAPDGRVERLGAGAMAERAGHYSARLRPEQPGVYRVAVEARRGSALLGAAATSMLVGGVDLEMTDPRLNTALLERVALASGGRMLAPGGSASLAESLRARIPAASLALRKDLWHNGWSFAIIVLLLGAEWGLRRRWGLR